MDVEDVELLVNVELGLTKDMTLARTCMLLVLLLLLLLRRLRAWS
jgi:hypothetical protein